MKLVGLVALMLLAPATKAAPAVEICRRFFPADTPVVSQTSNRIAKNRFIVSCVGMKNSKKAIIIVDQDEADARVLVSSRAFEDVAASSWTYVFENGGVVSSRVYAHANPVLADAKLLKWNLFAVEYQYMTDGEVGLTHSVRDIYRFDPKGCRLAWTIDDPAWGDAGDSGAQASEITADSKGLLIIQRNTIHELKTDDLDRIEVVRFRENGSQLVAVSTLTCVNVIDSSSSPLQTAALTTAGMFCKDATDERCEKRPGLPISVLKRVNGSNSAGKTIEFFEVKSGEGRHGYVPVSEELADCPVPKEEIR